MSRASPWVKSEASAGALKLVYPPAWCPWGLPAPPPPPPRRSSSCIPARQIKYLHRKKITASSWKGRLVKADMSQACSSSTAMRLFDLSLRKIESHYLLTRSDLLWKIKEWIKMEMVTLYFRYEQRTSCSKPTLQAHAHLEWILLAFLWLAFGCDIKT